MKILFAEYASEYENTSDEGDEVAEEDGEGTLDDWDKHLRLKRSHNSNELQRYLEEDLFPRRQKFDILKWWEIHSPKYLVLAAIAQDIWQCSRLQCLQRLHSAMLEGSSLNKEVV